VAFLEGVRDIGAAHHAFNRDVADGTVFDADGDTFPASTQVNGGWFVTPAQKIALEPAGFGVEKWVLTIPGGMVATMSIDEDDLGSIRASVRPYIDSWAWKPFADGTELEATCEEDGLYLVMATRTDADGDPPFLTLGASKVEALESCAALSPSTPPATAAAFDACLVGQWRMDLDRQVAFLRAVDPIKAQARTLTVDGTVSLRIDSSGVASIAVSGYREVEEHDDSGITTTSRGEASGRWQANGSVMRATWDSISFQTTIASYLGSGAVEAPPEWILQQPEVAAYRCTNTEFRYTRPPAFPVQIWTRVSD
jgi:hypothetical protein